MYKSESKMPAISIMKRVHIIWIIYKSYMNHIWGIIRGGCYLVGKRLCRRSIMCPEPLFSRGFERRKFLGIWCLLFASHDYFAVKLGFNITSIFLFSRGFRWDDFYFSKFTSSQIPTKKHYQRNVKSRLKSKILMWCGEKTSKI